MITKQYLVFLGDTYYPCGGWFDCAGSFDTIDEAKDFLIMRKKDWCHIVDLHTGLRVFTG